MAKQSEKPDIPVDMWLHVATDALARLEESYRAQLAARADPDDLAPEIFMLSGLFEMRELERVERLIGELQREHPKQPEAGLLVALYKKALRNAREGRK